MDCEFVSPSIAWPSRMSSGVKGAGVGMERSRDDERIKDGIPVSLGNVHGSLVGRNCKWHGLRTKDAK